MNFTNIQDFFQNLFTQWSSTDSWTILTLLGITALLGMIIGALLRGAKVARLKKALKKKEQQYKLLNAEHVGLQDQFKSQTQELQDRSVRMDNMEKEMQTYEKNQFTLRNNLSLAESKMKEVQAGGISGQAKLEYEEQLTDYENKHNVYQNRIAQQEAEILQLQSQAEDLEAEFEKLLDGKSISTTPSSVTINKVSTQVETLENRLSQVENESHSPVELSSLKPLSDQLSQLIHENQQLMLSIKDMYRTRIVRAADEDLLELKNRLTHLETIHHLDSSKVAPEDTESIHFSEISEGNEEEDEFEMGNDAEWDEVDMQQEKLIKTQESLSEVNSTRIETKGKSSKDDLSQINGVGPFIAGKLNEIGIYSFAQISQFDDQRIEEVTEQIQFFPGRIKRDDWVGQAKQLMDVGQQ